MADPRVERLASVLVHYSTNVQPGDMVAIHGMPEAAPLLLAIYEETLRAGGHPAVILTLPGADAAFFRLASEEQLTMIPPIFKMVIEEYDVRIGIRSESNTRELSAIPPARQRIHQKAMAPVFKTSMERGATGELKWCGAQYPTNSYAQEADMSLRDYENFVYGACFCDQEDPVARWKEMHEMQQHIIDWLEGRGDVRVTGPNADLTLSITGRTFVNSDGHHNMPSGEIFTGPVEDSAEGWVRFTYPAVVSGREVEGIELWFEEGKVVKATAKKNEEFLLEMLDTDPGARYLGEFAIGTNPKAKLIGNQAEDKKRAGTVHFAVGDNESLGGTLRSTIHLDGVLRSPTVRLDGEVVVDDGRLLVE